MVQTDSQLRFMDGQLAYWDRVGSLRYTEVSVHWSNIFPLIIYPERSFYLMGLKRLADDVLGPKAGEPPGPQPVPPVSQNLVPRCLDRLPTDRLGRGKPGQARPVYGGIGFDFPDTVEDMLAILDSQKVDDSLSVLHLLTALAYHLCREHASFETVADIVRQSEPLSVELISAAGFPRGQSPTILEALLRLGTRRIQRVVSDHSFRQIHRTFRSESPRDINRNNVWTFSYSHALLAQRCDDACGGGGDVYLPALLERTGVIIFNQFFFESYAELLLAKPRERSRYEWEDEHLGYNSIEIGARYLEHLGIPDLAGKVRAQFVPQSEADQIRYFARHLTARKVPVFRDDATYDPAIIAQVAERFGPELERTSVEYLRNAFRRGRAA